MTSKYEEFCFGFGPGKGRNAKKIAEETLGYSETELRKHPMQKLSQSQSQSQSQSHSRSAGIGGTLHDDDITIPNNEQDC